MYQTAYDISINKDNFYNFKSIFYCPTAIAQGFLPPDNQAGSDQYDEIPGTRPIFSYAMNSKSLAYENINSVVTVLKVNMVKHPSAFVLFEDVRNRSSETPFYGTTANQIKLATPHGYTTRFSSRHNQGGQLTFSDGHASYYKYSYVVSPGPPTSTMGPGYDPNQVDINWDCSGNPVPPGSSGG